MIKQFGADGLKRLRRAVTNAGGIRRWTDEMNTPRSSPMAGRTSTGPTTGSARRSRACATARPTFRQNSTSSAPDSSASSTSSTGRARSTTGLRGWACRASPRRAARDYRNTYRKRVPLQKRSSWAPSDAPCERFSELGTCRTSAFQPRGLRPRSKPRPRPRPTAGGYSSRSKPSRVGTSRNNRSRRSSAPRRFTTSRSGQPRRSTARRKCRRMFGYSTALKTSRCTPAGRTHGADPRSSGTAVAAAGQSATASNPTVTTNSLCTHRESSHDRGHSRRAANGLGAR
jgi:hypothetical protein